jgi:D-beta-D-heptose 7-phosphate kinase/D-beta-D-heptose 1-phosphate adenosyltransferase
VDLVVRFDEDTPLALIETLRPDVLVKGNDYRIDQVVGRESVEAYGGRIELVSVLTGHSTTNISNKIKCNIKLDN